MWWRSAMYLLLSYEGRIRRRDFWLGELLSVVLAMVFGAIGVLLDITLHTPRFDRSLGPIGGVGPFYLLACLVTLYSTYAVWVKRLHDRNKRARWLLLLAIPILGPAWLLIEAGFFPGTADANDWGDNPRGRGPGTPPDAVTGAATI